MARIVELTYPDNVTLVPGAVQNWVDLESAGASSPLVRAFVLDVVDALPAEARRTCLVVGPHAPELLRALADRVDALTVVVRSIPDAATTGSALPDARVLCGTLPPASESDGTYDLVVALDDLTRVLSLEDDQDRSWQELFDRVRTRVAAEGLLLLGVENELGLHRTAAPADPRLADDDANWSPLATWDASRPRTLPQLAAVLDHASLAARVRTVHPTWSDPTVLGAALEPGPAVLRHLLAALALRPVGSRPGGSHLLPTRAVAMADRLPEACAGWLVVASAAGTVPEESPAIIQLLADGRTARWTAQGELAQCESPDGRVVDVLVPEHGRTLLLDLTEAALASDTPRLRRTLTQWLDRLRALAVDGIVPAEFADARFGNLLGGTTPADPVPLAPASSARPLDEVTWSALADLFHQWRATGTRTPWPSSMHPTTAFLALVAMAQAPAPDDVTRWVSDPDPHTYADRSPDRQELMAVIARQEEELRGTWARFHWDEKDYLAYKAGKLARRVPRFVRREGVRKTLRRLLRGLRRP